MDFAHFPKNPNEYLKLYIKKVKSIGKGETTCILCVCGMEGTELHLFKNCEIIEVLAFQNDWECLMEAWSFTSLKEFLGFC